MAPGSWKQDCGLMRKTQNKNEGPGMEDQGRGSSIKHKGKNIWDDQELSKTQIIILLIQFKGNCIISKCLP